MTAALEDIFWEQGRSGTAPQIQQDWDVYDLWAKRMSDETAARIINRTSTAGSSSSSSVAPSSMPTEAASINPTSGSKGVYSQPPSSSSELMASKVGIVKARGHVKAHVKAHGVVMYRLRSKGASRDAL